MSAANILTQIPIRNLWYLLLYAWGETPRSPYWAMIETVDAPTQDALLASILVRLVRQRSRIGFGRDYTETQAKLRGIRGRVQFSQSVKQQAFASGNAVCNFDHYTINVPKNQVILSTLHWLWAQGDLGTNAKEAKALRHKLRQTCVMLTGVDRIPLAPATIQRLQLQRHDRDYHVMLSLCAYLLQQRLPTQDSGTSRFSDLNNDDVTLYRVFEKFVANFYQQHLIDWRVFTQKRLKWPDAEHQYLPTMQPDIVFEHKQSKQVVVLDTKFTAKSLQANHYKTDRFDSSHLYQMYAYLRTQDEESVQHAQAKGILLYPTVATQLSETLTMGQHQLAIECVDLAAEWQEIEAQLLGLMQLH